MTTKRRNFMEIVENILTVALNGASKTQLVYRANLNFKMCQRYLDNLVSKNLLTLGESSTKKYVTAEKGREFLNRYKKVKKLF